MGPALLRTSRRVGRITAAGMVFLQAGCASLGRSGPAAGYDCLAVENETADAVMVYLDVGNYAVELGRIGPASRRALPLRRADLPDRFTHAYLRIVPAPPESAWPPPPPPVAELIRTADANRTLWRYTGRSLTPIRAAGTEGMIEPDAPQVGCSGEQDWL